MDVLKHEEKICFLCKRPATDRHHVFAGARKKQSDKDGNWVWLCRRCHNKVQDSAEEMKALQKHVQILLMKENGWTEKEFQKKYLRSFI